MLFSTRFKLILISFLPSLTAGFHTPINIGKYPYGRQLRAMLSRRIPYMEDDRSWWHSLSRNNTIDCKCGQYTKSNMTDRWTEEGITELNEYSFSVSLVSPGQNYAYCGGVLINDRHVLTSASCVDGAIASGVEVLIGTWPRAHFVAPATDPDELNHRKLIRKKVVRVVLHPKYSPDHLDYNIALLRLYGPVQTFANEGGIVPVCLPSESDNFDGQNSTSLLWRFHTDDETIVPVKRTEVVSKILSKDECKAEKYNKEWENMPDSMICAQFEKPESEEHPYYHSYDCPGDAGGGLLVTRGDQKVLVGIDSFTACYGRPKGVGVFTRVTEFLPWLKLHISQDGRNCAY